MCRFFSCASDGHGKVYYQDAEARRKIKDGHLAYFMDSHTSIAHQHGFCGEAEDRLNKWEYNPLTKRVKADQINTLDDQNAVEQFCRNLDWSAVVPELVVKPIVHPFRDRHAESVAAEDLALLRRWDSVWGSASDSVRATVRDSVWATVSDTVSDSVSDSVSAPVWDSLSASVRDLVWDSARATVRDSVWNLVWDSARASIWAYTGSFYQLVWWKYIEHRSGKYPFQPAVDLWDRGLVPSYDGRQWRLHGHEGKVLWTGKLEEV